MKVLYIDKQGIRMTADRVELQGACYAARAILIEKIRDDWYLVRLVASGPGTYLVEEMTRDEMMQVVLMCDKQASFIISNGNVLVEVADKNAAIQYLGYIHEKKS